MYSAAHSPHTASFVQGDGSEITVQPGLIGGEVNKILAAHKKKHNHPIQYKIGPDPSSIDSCMVGGMVSNNSSGMCCGVSQNTYHTLKDMRVVFVDGTVLDTADPASRESFLKVCFWGGLHQIWDVPAPFAVRHAVCLFSLQEWLATLQFAHWFPVKSKCSWKMLPAEVLQEGLHPRLMWAFVHLQWTGTETSIHLADPQRFGGGCGEPGQGGAGRPSAGQPHPQEICYQVHHRLLAQRPGRFPHRWPHWDDQAADHRQRGHLRLRLPSHLQHCARVAWQGMLLRSTVRDVLVVPSPEACNLLELYHCDAFVLGRAPPTSGWWCRFAEMCKYVLAYGAICAHGGSWMLRDTPACRHLHLCCSPMSTQPAEQPQSWGTRHLLMLWRFSTGPPWSKPFKEPAIHASSNGNYVDNYLDSWSLTLVIIVRAKQQSLLSGAVDCLWMLPCYTVCYASNTQILTSASCAGSVNSMAVCKSWCQAFQELTPLQQACW